MSESSTPVTTRVREEAQDMGQKVQETAVQAKEQGTRQLEVQFDQRTTQAGQQANKLAGALRRSGTELGTQQDGEMTSRLTHGAAERLEQLGSYLENVRGDEMLRDVERMARQRPWLVAGAAAVAGFAASRLLKASSERRYEVSGDWTRPQGAM
jgi:hypothetical protein